MTRTPSTRQRIETRGGLDHVVVACIAAVLAGSAATVAVAAQASPPATPAPALRELRVCADPNNLPFSNEREEGFENALAQMLGAELGLPVRYTWWAQRRGFVRNTLRARECDVLMGVPVGFEMARTTRPYYRSSYVFVTRRDRRLRLASFEDPRLTRLRIGVHTIGDDGANAPPAHALSARGLTRNLVGFSIYGDYAQPNPPARLVEAVASGAVDAAVVWGPIAGYFARQQRVPLEVTPVSARDDSPALPLAYDIALGVRRDDGALAGRLEAALARRRNDVRRLLTRFGVPWTAPAERSTKPNDRDQ